MPQPALKSKFIKNKSIINTNRKRRYRNEDG